MLLDQSCGHQHLLFQQPSEKVLLHMKTRADASDRHEMWTPTLASAGNKLLGFMVLFLSYLSPFPECPCFSGDKAEEATGSLRVPVIFASIQTF